MPTAQDVVSFLGVEGDADMLTRARVHLPLMTALVKSYTRGRGFVAGVAAEDLDAVILTSTARLVTNPSQVNSESQSQPVLRFYAQGGPATPVVAGLPQGEGRDPVVATEAVGHSGAFTGWTEAERAILHRWRLRNG